MRKNQKLLTVSIAAYNISDYLTRCLESLILDDEHMEKLEVLIVNDGSTDDTLDVAKSFAKRFPKTFKVIDKKNGGYGTTVNEGLKVATGKYFRIFDGDDEFDAKNLAKFIDALEEAESDMVSTPRIRMFDHDNRTELCDPFQNNVSGEKPISIICGDECNHEQFCGHSIVYKTAVLKKANITLPGKILYTDNIFVICPLVNIKTIFVTHIPTYIYHIGREDQSTSVENRIKHVEDYREVIEFILKHSNKHGVNNAAYNKYFGICCANYISSFKILLPISKKNYRDIKKFDSDIKKQNYEAWRSMAGFKTVRLLRMTHFLRITYIALHLERKTKLKGHR